jgi:hypothetical protein
MPGLSSTIAQLLQARGCPEAKPATQAKLVPGSGPTGGSMVDRSSAAASGGPLHEAASIVNVIAFFIG